MEVGIALLAGIVVGWLIEWVIDWQYWRRGIAGFYANETALRAELAESEDNRQSLAEALEKSQDELASARAQLQAANVREAELQRRVQNARLQDAETPQTGDVADANDTGCASVGQPVSVPAQVDDLSLIAGASETDVQRMYDAGVTTFAQVADADTEELEQIVHPAAWQHIDFSEWKRQAKELAEERAAANESKEA
jgi:predicted flap endonuclease-1-like 5' DNA nuclease